MNGKKLLSLLLCAALALTLLPATAQAADSDFTVAGDSMGYTYAGGVLTFTASGAYTVSMTAPGTATTDTIAVNPGVTADITLSGVRVELDRVSGGCAFHIAVGAAVNLTLVGDNTLRSGATNAGLQCPEGASVVIGGAGSLLVVGGQKVTNDSGAGIGSGYGMSGGNITIESGAVEAVGGYASAGIGSGGSTGNGGVITISGGSVTARGGVYTYTPGNFDPGTGSGAGIGGGNGGSGGTVTISSGTVIASGGKAGGSGIGGGGNSGNGGMVTISGGMVIATSGSNSTRSGGSGIGGGGRGGNGGTVTISGGTVVATGGKPKISGEMLGGGSGIGGGGGDPAAGTGGALYISGGSLLTTNNAGIYSNNGVPATPMNRLGGDPVYLTTVALSGVTAETAVTALTISLTGDPYATKDMQTDVDGNLYLYLPDGTSTTGARTAFAVYSGEVATTTVAGTSSGILSPEMTPPTVVGVTPSGTGAARAGDLVVTFSEEMRTAAGTVALSTDGIHYTPLGSGSWISGNTVYRVSYAALLYQTAYTVKIEGFQDYSGNGMDADAAHTFTTVSEPVSSGDAPTTYLIKASAGEGGGIRPAGSVFVSSGSGKTYTVTAVKGYEIADVLVDGISVGAVSSYTFKNINRAHTIAASFKIVNPFADVTRTDWFYDSVMDVYARGLMTGSAFDTFSPNAGMTRAMLVTVLCRMSGDGGRDANAFTDVPAGAWYESAAAWAAAKGIAGGVDGSRFAPDRTISRQELAVMLWRYAKYKGYDVSIGEDTNILSYGDALTIAEYAYPALQWACGAGILTGDADGNLSPNESATRAEVAAMLERFFKNAAS